LLNASPGILIVFHYQQGFDLAGDQSLDPLKRLIQALAFSRLGQVTHRAFSIGVQHLLVCGDDVKELYHQ